jgi:hypothetical protein
MQLSSNLTDLGEVCIPCPFNEFKVLRYDASQLTQSPGIKTGAFSQMDRGVQPKLGFTFTAAHMDVGWLPWITFIRIKKNRNPL